jgi:phenylacetate-coenzyme A ligase PaaK-like adenylate-forming protein
MNASPPAIAPVAADPSDLAAYRAAQLGNTLLFIAESSPYYRALLGRRELSDMSPDAVLSRLPVMTSDRWAAARGALRTGPVSHATLGYTGNTTTRLPSPFLNTPRELGAVRAVTGARPSVPELILVGRGGHGPAGLAGFDYDAVVLSLCSPKHYEQVEVLLEHAAEPFASMPRIGAIDSSLVRVKALSLYLLRHRGRMDDLGISRITVGRNILSPRWRSRLETWWAAGIRPAYGFSEMRMCNSAECQECGYYHMPPTGLAEILDEDRGWEPVRAGGRGMLAVTGFYPFIELEPRIRYLPGDVAELAPTACPRWAEHGFRPIGRRQDSARLPVTGNWVGPVDIYAALADHPAVNSVVTPAMISEGLDELTSSPRFRIEAGNPVRLHVEFRISPLVWEKEWTAARNEIQEQLPDGVELVPHEPGEFETSKGY